MNMFYYAKTTTEAIFRNPSTLSGATLNFYRMPAALFYGV